MKSMKPGLGALQQMLKQNTKPALPPNLPPNKATAVNAFGKPKKKKAPNPFMMKVKA
jgi:hypothetical protein